MLTEGMWVGTEDSDDDVIFGMYPQHLTRMALMHQEGTIGVLLIVVMTATHDAWATAVTTVINPIISKDAGAISGNTTVLKELTKAQ